MNVLIIIPAYNEQDCIESVVDNLILHHQDYDYVIVNDGSTDLTADICRKRGYRFIDLSVNLGLAGAFQAGIKYALKHDYDAAVQFDADGQHKAEYLDALVSELDNADIVIGSRFVHEAKPRSMRMLGSNLIEFMVALTTGHKLTDPTSGMRAYGKKAIAQLAFGPNLGPEPDTLAYLMRKHDMKISEVQVTMGERLAGDSYLNIKNSSLYMARMALSVLLIQFFR